MTETLQILIEELQELSEEEQERVIFNGINRMRTKKMWNEMSGKTRQEFMQIAWEAGESIRKRKKENEKED